MDSVRNNIRIGCDQTQFRTPDLLKIHEAVDNGDLHGIFLGLQELPDYNEYESFVGSLSALIFKARFDNPADVSMILEILPKKCRSSSTFLTQSGFFKQYWDISNEALLAMIDTSTVSKYEFVHSQFLDAVLQRDDSESLSKLLCSCITNDIEPEPPIVEKCIRKLSASSWVTVYLNGLLTYIENGGSVDTSITAPVFSLYHPKSIIISAYFDSVHPLDFYISTLLSDDHRIRKAGLISLFIILSRESTIDPPILDTLLNMLLTDRFIIKKQALQLLVLMFKHNPSPEYLTDTIQSAILDIAISSQDTDVLYDAQIYADIAGFEVDSPFVEMLTTF